MTFKVYLTIASATSTMMVKILILKPSLLEKYYVMHTIPNWKPKQVSFVILKSWMPKLGLSNLLAQFIKILRNQFQILTNRA